jgi:uncharacterized protein YccT (UPF0319 family)
MPSFHIVQAKYPRKKRAFFFIASFTSCFIFLLTLSYLSHNNPIASISGVVVIAVAFSYFSYVFNKTVNIGTLDMDDSKVKISVGNIHKNFKLDDLENVKLRVGTGNTRYVKNSTSFVVQFNLKSQSAIMVHLLRDSEKEKIAGTSYTKPTNLFAVFDDKKISYAFDRKLKEEDCIV